MARTEDGDGSALPGAFDVVRLVEDLLAGAVSHRASDVHFEPTADGLLVRYRLDVTLQTIEQLPRALAENVIDSGEGWLTELSTEALREMLTLRQDAVQG